MWRNRDLGVRRPAWASGCRVMRQICGATPAEVLQRPWG